MAKVFWRSVGDDAVDRQRLIDCGANLSVFPRRGCPAGADRRKMTIVPPHVLSYRVDPDDTVPILDVRHGARRPQD